MTMLNTAGSWHVGRASGRCVACGAELPPNTECWAALCDGGKVRPVGEDEKGGGGGGGKGKKEEPVQSPFVRVDFCEKCWGEGKRPEGLAAGSLAEVAPGAAKLEMFSFWKTTVPMPQQKKKLLVDDSVLVDVFSRMEGKNEPQEVRFRFVLALILMRKRLLKYEGMEETAAAAPATSAPAQGNAGGEVEGKRPEVWRMLPRGEGAVAVHVINPHLTAEQIAEVSQQLSAILAEEV